MYFINPDLCVIMSPPDDKCEQALTDHATTSIDAQDFIWEKDETRVLLFDRFLRTANRHIVCRLCITG